MMARYRSDEQSVVAHARDLLCGTVDSVGVLHLDFTAFFYGGTVPCPL